MTAPAMRPMTRAECEGLVDDLAGAARNRILAGRLDSGLDDAPSWEDLHIAQELINLAAHYRATLEGMP